MHWRFGRRIMAVALAACTLLICPSYAAPPTTADRVQIGHAESALTRAGNFFKAKRYEESGAAAREAIAILQKLPLDDSQAWKTLIDPLERQLTRAKQLLAAEKVEIPAWTTAEQLNNATSVSFVKQIAAILNTHCGNCHIQRARGDFSMASFAALMKGSPSGIVVMSGSAADSRLVEVIESGDMPRGGGKLSDSDLALLKSWIDNGAKFDGDDDTASLASLGSDNSTQMARLEVVAADSGDPVQFARDIGPVLQANCLECHGERNPRANFGMSTFNQFLRGGDNGAPLVPGKPADSLIIRKLRGTAAGARMPQGRDPLPEETIARVEKWIELGAKFDGGNPEMPLDDVIAQSAASRMTHDELSRQRLELSQQTWRLILPDTEANRAESKNVLVVGGVGKEVLSDVARVADEQVDKLRKLFKVPADKPLIRGRLTIYVFDKRYDYGEVGTMLEHRELPTTWRGHWAYNPLEPYGCILLEQNGEAPPGLVAQQIAGVYLASLGKIPRWFAEGSARAIAARVDSKDPRVQQWDDQVAEVLSTTEKPEGFLSSDLPPEESDLLSYSFVSRFLMVPSTKYAAFVSALQQGTEFDQAFSKVYGSSPQELVPGWLARVVRRRR